MKILKALSGAGLLLITVSLTAQAQLPINGTETILEKLRLNKGIEGIQNTSYSDIQGNPYLFKDFQEGEVSLKTGEKYKGLFRYDIYAREVHYKVKDIIYAVALPETIDYIEMNDGTRFIYSAFKTDNDTKKGKESTYFVVLANGKCKLLAEKNIRIQDAELPKAYQEAKPAKFIHRKDTYYLKLDDNPAVVFKNEKDLLNILEDKKDYLKGYISSNKLSVNNSEDLIKIIIEYNEN